MKTFNRFVPRFLFGISLLVVACTPKVEDEDPAHIKTLRRAGYEAQLKGDQFYYNGRNDSAFKYHVQAKNFYERSGDNLGTAYALLQIAELYRQANDYVEMQNSVVEAMKLPDTSNRYKKTIFLQLGISYSELGDLPHAIENYRKARKYVTEKWEGFTIDNNIGNAYLFRDEYQKAFEVLRPVATNTLADSLPIKATLLDNYAFAASKLKKQNGLDLMLQALELRKRNADSLGLITSYLHLSETLHDSGNQKFMAYADSAETIARLHHSPVDRLEVLQFITENAPADKLAKYAPMYVRLNDSLHDQWQKSRNMFAEIKYNHKFEREKRLKSELDTEKQKSQKQQWIFAAILLGAMVIGIILFYLKRKEQISKRVAYETEVRISNRLHDGLANEAHRAIVFVENHDLSDPENKEELLNRLDLIYSGTRSISHENREIPKEEDYAKFLRDLLKEYNSDQCTIIAQGIDSVNWLALSELKRIEFSRIVQELLTNMRKHSNCSLAVFSFSSAGKKLRLSYSDNGQGNGKSDEKRKNGLRIMENRISSLGGTATFESEAGKGFRVTMEISL